MITKKNIPDKIRLTMTYVFYQNRRKTACFLIMT